MKYLIRKKYLTVLFLFFIASAVFSQSSLSIFGGINLSSRTPERVYWEHKTTFGYNLGGLYEYSFTDYFALSGGLETNTRGSAFFVMVWHPTFPDNYISFDLTAQRKVQYLDLPIYAKFYMHLSPKVNLFGAIGPFVGIALFGMYDRIYFESDDLDSYPKTKLEYVKGRDLAKPRWEAGINYRIGIEYMKFTFSAAYSMGLVNHAEEYYNPTYALNVERVNQWAIQFSLGYRFSFEKK
ncbi:hypothetical protein GCM10009118_04850 [Wandonia haliotis]|uniref:Outer membrane protein beta-barrel domain-containing protein n=1 Tax=Wandonia haliotis TaxID=574963 RepID=A0ABN1MM90_9FLAO